MQKKVAIFTTFTKWDESYSLTSVVHDQLVMHVKNGYTPVLFVLESFDQVDINKIPEGVEVRGVIPQIILEPYKGLAMPQNWREDVEKVKKALREHAMDIEIMLTHDIMFIDTYLPYNIALREAELPCKYFHWVHSAPSPRPDLKDNMHANRYTLPPNSKLVYLNNDKALALAEMYGTYLRNVRVVYNSRDPRTFWNLHPLVNQLIDKYDILSADIISIFPVSAPRMIGGKQLDVVIQIHDHLKALGLKTKLIVCDAHANGTNEHNAALERRTNDVIFTSLVGNGKFGGFDILPYPGEQDRQYEQGVPSKVVSDLFRLSNVFIFPTISENSSLVLAEAMLAGNLLVLNEDVETLREHAGAGNAIYLKMGSFDMGTRTKEHALERTEYLRDIAKIIKSEWEVSKPLQAKRRALTNQNLDVTFSRIEALYFSD